VNNSPCRFDKTHIARELLAYLAEHPGAEDTLDGIVQWWLLERKLKYQVRLIIETLTGLVMDGYVVERRQPHSNPLYGINRERNREIRKIVQENARSGTRSPAKS
jgi:hypothetical protein